MKKVCLVVMMMLLSFMTVVYADDTEWAEPTDIFVDIDEYYFSGYLVNGKVCVAVEDLKSYGFEVVWDETQRLIHIKARTFTDKTGLVEAYRDVEREVIRTPILPSDIQVKVRDKIVESYGIEGTMLIPFQSLVSFGFFRMYPYSYQFYTVYDEFNISDGMGYEAWLRKDINMKLELRNGNYYMTSNDLKIGYLSDYARFNLNLVAETLGYKRNQGYYSNGSYGFKLINNKTVDAYYQGKKYGTYTLDFPCQSIHTPYITDMDLAQLFGMDKLFNPDDLSIEMTYYDYDVLNDGDYVLKDDYLTVKLETNVDIECYFEGVTSINREYVDDKILLSVSGHINPEVKDVDVIFSRGFRKMYQATLYNIQ